jgi:tetratricopeptide (TPR) repeat protein
MEGEKDNSCIAEILQMREKGNQLYQAGKYNESIDVWFESLKSSLKSSVRFASSKLYENQFLCRLNLAMAYLKLENWIDAKEQSQLVLEQQPRNVKALLRLARAYEGLQVFLCLYTVSQ